MYSLPVMCELHYLWLTEGELTSHRAPFRLRIEERCEQQGKEVKCDGRSDGVLDI
jgi:hypothetical protein